MKHINLSKCWQWSREPFPAYRAELIFGRNKWDREFLPIQGIPVPDEFKLVARYYNTALGTYTTHDDADAARVAHNSSPERDRLGVAVIEKPFPLLPENAFRVIKTREKGTIMVVPGEDITNRCLLFVDCEGGFRGGDALLAEGTSCTVLKKCSAGSACESASTYAVIMEPGQTLALSSWGRYGKYVYLYTWNGVEVEKKDFTREEWDAKNTPAGEEETEVL